MSNITRPYTESSLTCGFYNGVNHDRKYYAEQMSDLFEGIINDGVFVSVGKHFSVTPKTGNTVVVGTGRAWFNGTWTNNDASLPVDCGESEVAFDRIDAVVLQVNTNPDVRDNTIEVIKGVPSNDPIKPDLVKTDGVYQYALAYVYRTADSAEIKQTDITNAIGTEETPYSTGIMQTASIDYLYANWEAEFIEWFDSLRVILSGDVAGNLHNEIEAVSADLQAYKDATFDNFSFYKVAEFKEAGTYTWIPNIDQQIAVFVLVGAGQGGQGGSCGGSDSKSYGGDGGCGGDVIISHPLAIKPNEPISIVVGAGSDGSRYCNKQTEAANVAGPGGSTSCLGMVAAGGHTRIVENGNNIIDPISGIDQVYYTDEGMPVWFHNNTDYYLSASDSLSLGRIYVYASGGTSGYYIKDSDKNKPTAGRTSYARLPFYPFDTLSASGGGGGCYNSYYSNGKNGGAGGVTSLGNGGAGGTASNSFSDAFHGGDGANGCGGGGGASSANATTAGNGGKGGDGYVAIYVLGRNPNAEEATV